MSGHSGNARGHPRSSPNDHLYWSRTQIQPPLTNVPETRWCQPPPAPWGRHDASKASSYSSRSKSASGVMETRGEPSLRPGRTIFGHAIVDGEEIGTLPRCLRLMAAAVRVLESEEMAQPEAVGVPLGDGHGMESLVTRLAPLFARDRSLVRWVALKGALLFLDTSFLSDIEWRTAMLSMGLEHSKSPYTGEDEIQVLERPGPISPVVISQILGLHASIMMGLAEFERISKASLGDYSLITFPDLPAPKLRRSARRKVLHNSTGKDERLLRTPGNPGHGNGPSF